MRKDDNPEKAMVVSLFKRGIPYGIDMPAEIYEYSIINRVM